MDRTLTKPGWWDLTVFGAIAVVAVITALDDGQVSVGVWVTLAVFVLVYVAWGRRLIPVEPRGTPALAYSTLLAVLTGVGVAFSPSIATLQCAVYPLIWCLARSLRQAIVSNVLVAVAVFIGYGISDGAGGLGVAAIVAAISLAFSIALGLWITRIAEFGAERARLLAELEAAQDALAAAHRDAGVVSERERLAREIHDTIAQSLTGLVMLAQRAEGELAAAGDDPAQAVAAAETVELIEQMARESLTEARGLVAAMSPVRVDSTLTEAIGRLATRFERETGMRVAASVDTGSPPPDRELEVVLLRAAQEGLANVRKHARASAASVRIARAGETIVLEVVDDGIGVDATTNPSSSGFGVAGLRDRVSLVGGSVSVGPGADGGAVLRVSVPAPAPAAPSPAAPAPTAPVQVRETVTTPNQERQSGRAPSSPDPRQPQPDPRQPQPDPRQPRPGRAAGLPR